MKKVLIVVALIAAIIVGLLGGRELSRIGLQGISISYVDAGQDAKKKGDYIEAIASFNKAVVLDPNSSLAHWGLAESYDSIKRYDLALEEYEATINVMKNESDAIKVINKRVEELKGLIQEGQVTQR